MRLGGHVNMSGPEFKKGEFYVEPDENTSEFTLKLEESKDLAIDGFEAWVKMDEDKEITIETEYGVNEEPEDYLYLEITSKQGGTLSITLNVKQASMLAQIFEHFRQGYYAIQALKKKQRVDIV